MAHKVFQVVRDDAVVNVLMVPAAAVVAEGGARLSWDGDGIDAPEGEHFAHVPGAQIGWIVEGGTLVPPPVRAPDVDVLRATLIAAVDAEAERQRQRWITPGAGQAMTYARKVDEATALQAASGTPQASDYPMLAATIGIDGDTLAAVAAKVLDMDAAWTPIGAAIERRRLSLKRDIAAASSAALLAEIDIAVGWPEGAG